MCMYEGEKGRGGREGEEGRGKKGRGRKGGGGVGKQMNRNVHVGGPLVLQIRHMTGSSNSCMFVPSHSLVPPAYKYCYSTCGHSWGVCNTDTDSRQYGGEESKGGPGRRWRLQTLEIIPMPTNHWPGRQQWAHTPKVMSVCELFIIQEMSQSLQSIGS